MVEYEYKCRRCGVVFVVGVCPATVPHEVVEAQLSSVPPFQNLPTSIAFKVHKCEAEGAGLADWVGCKSE